MNTEKIQQQQIQTKWGTGLDAGFLVLPVVLLKRQAELKLDCTELVVLQNLLAAWWDADKLPFPRSATIASRMGLSPRTVQRCLVQLEEKGLIRCIRQKTGTGAAARSRTKYDLDATVQKVKALAESAKARQEPVPEKVMKTDLTQSGQFEPGGFAISS